MPPDSSTKNPRLIIILSGKRKCGKDYVAKCLFDRFGKDKAVIIRLSGPLKQMYALEHDLDFSQLLDSSPYKEQFRGDMIRWGESVRARDPSFFCRNAVDAAPSVPVWIVSDARRPSDLRFFRTRYPGATRSVRISAPQGAREARGFKFTEGVDDCESECALDDCGDFDFRLRSESHEQLAEELDGMCRALLGQHKINLH